MLLISITTLHSDEINLNFDYSLFKLGDGKYSLNYYYEIPYTKLFFLKSGGFFTSRYQIALQIWNQNELIAGKSVVREIKIVKYEDTKQQYQNYLDSLNINFDNQSINISKLTADIQIEDLNSNNSGKTQFAFLVPKLVSGMKFFKNHTVNPTRIYSTEQNKSETLNIHLEIYTKTVENCSLWIKKMSALKSYALYTSSIDRNASFCDFSYPLVNLSDKGSGEYKIIICGYDNMDRQVFETEENFVIKNSFLSSDLEYLEMVNRLLYTATESEMKNLKQTTTTNRESTWHAFWEQHDPTPTTDINESEQEYFSRIDYCIEHFSKGDKSYQSERAKIYMKYGPPDFTDSRPFERHSNAYEIWYYYNIGKQFTFIDSHGFGEFILYEEKML
jgi:GWxTD domain-containing protein